jgi:hypothetical protein
LARVLFLLLEARGGTEVWEGRRGLNNRCWTGGGPGEVSRSRKESSGPFRDGVSSKTGGSDVARAKGLRSVGSLDTEEGVRPDPDRIGVGDRLA